MEILFPILILLFSVILHEVAHGFVALYLGDPTARLAGRLTLNPLKHLDPIGSLIVPLVLFLLQSPVLFGWAKPVPYNPYNLQAGRWGPAYVAAAGPAVNILLAAIFAFLARLGLAGGWLPPLAAAAFGLIILINLVLAIFNLIPIPPLDGSKILFSLLPYRYQTIADSLNAYYLLILLFVVFFVWRFIILGVLQLAIWLASPEVISLAIGELLMQSN